MRYAGLAAQLLVAIGLAVFLGMKADKWLHCFPLLTCLLPLLVLTGIFYRIFQDTSKKQ